MKTSILFALLTIAASLMFTAAKGWDFSPEINEDYYTGLALHGMLTCQVFHPGFAVDNCQPTAYRLPVYPVVLGAVLRILGKEAGARALQSVLFGLLVFMTCQIVAKYAGSPAIAGVAMLPNYIFYVYTDWLTTELFFTFLSLLLLFALFHKRFALSALLIGVLFLTRGTFLFTAPLLILFVIPARKWLMCGAIILMVMLPWWVRNEIELHAFIPFSTGSGFVLIGADNPQTWDDQLIGDGLPSGFWNDISHTAEWDSLGNLPELARDQAETSEAVAFVRSQPLSLILKEIVARFLNFWGRGGTTIATVLFLVCLPVGLIYRQRANKRLIVLCSIFIIGALVNCIVFWSGFRFRMPVEPMMAIVSGLLFPRLRRAINDRPASEMPGKFDRRVPAANV